MNTPEREGETISRGPVPRGIDPIQCSSAQVSKAPDPRSPPDPIPPPSRGRLRGGERGVFFLLFGTQVVLPPAGRRRLSLIRQTHMVSTRLHINDPLFRSAPSSHESRHERDLSRLAQAVSRAGCKAPSRGSALEVQRRWLADGVSHAQRLDDGWEVGTPKARHFATSRGTSSAAPRFALLASFSLLALVMTIGRRSRRVVG